jgi:rSAM/selenodomain-associated transferase 2
MVNVSVVIPTLNEAGNLKELLPLLSASLNADDEIIVCDASSADGSAEVALELGAKVLQPKKGRASQMNAGAQAAKNQILYFVHADTRPPVTFRNDVVKYYSEGKKIGCYRFKFDSDSKWLKINSYFTKFDKIMCRGGDQTLFVCKDFFSDLNGFDEEHVIMEDYDFILRARKKSDFVIMNGDAIVSPRKYVENSYMRVNLSNLVIFKLYQLGVKPQRLDSLYKRLIKHPKA